MNRASLHAAHSRHSFSSPVPSKNCITLSGNLIEPSAELPEPGAQTLRSAPGSPSGLCQAITISGHLNDRNEGRVAAEVRRPTGWPLFPTPPTKAVRQKSTPKRLILIELSKK
jgi:hypothetical protein